MLSIKSFLDGKLKIISAIGSSNSNIIKWKSERFRHIIWHEDVKNDRGIIWITN
jgi:hypothetical protein